MHDQRIQQCVVTCFTFGLLKIFQLIDINPSKITYKNDKKIALRQYYSTQLSVSISY